METLIPVERWIHVDALNDALDVVRPVNFYFPGESHDFWEMVFVCEGAVAATAEERIYHLDAGNLIFHKPMEFHRIWSEKDSSPHLIILSFRAGGPGMTRFENRCFALSAAQRKRLENLTATFQQAMALRHIPDGAQLQQAVSLTATLLESFLLRLTEQEEQIPQKLSGEDAQYAKIVNVMKANCHKSMTLEELAHRCGLSVSNMKRIFSRFSDMGVGKYFRWLKIRRAMELLEGDLPASQVAQMLDFSETSYFYAVFKRETGMTPTQYKKSRSDN